MKNLKFFFLFLDQRYDDPSAHDISFPNFQNNVRKVRCDSIWCTATYTGRLRQPLVHISKKIFIKNTTYKKFVKTHVIHGWSRTRRHWIYSSLWYCPGKLIINLYNNPLIFQVHIHISLETTKYSAGKKLKSTDFCQLHIFCNKYQINTYIFRFMASDRSIWISIRLNERKKSEIKCSASDFFPYCTLVKKFKNSKRKYKNLPNTASYNKYWIWSVLIFRKII